MLLDKANQLLAENKLKKLNFTLKRFLMLNPESGEALFGLGRIALRLERYDAAVYLITARLRATLYARATACLSGCF